MLIKSHTLQVCKIRRLNVKSWKCYIALLRNKDLCSTPIWSKLITRGNYKNDHDAENVIESNHRCGSWRETKCWWGKESIQNHIVAENLDCAFKTSRAQQTISVSYLQLIRILRILRFTLPVRVISLELHRFASFLMGSFDEKVFREG